MAQGTDAGTQTSIVNSTAAFVIGTFDGGTDYLDGLIDDVRIWNAIRSATDIANARSAQLLGSETNLQGYWRLNNNYTDLTSNNNTLTASGSPVFSTDVPFTGGVILNLTSKIW